MASFRNSTESPILISACMILPSGPTARESSSAPSAFLYHAIASLAGLTTKLGVMVRSPSGMGRFALAMIPSLLFGQQQLQLLANVADSDLMIRLFPQNLAIRR